MLSDMKGEEFDGWRLIALQNAIVLSSVAFPTLTFNKDARCNSSSHKTISLLCVS